MRVGLNGAAFLPLPLLKLKFAILAMKLCPQCHFTFDDDRSVVCDFDGSELTTIPDPAPLSDRIVPPSKKSNPLQFATSRSGLAGLAGLLLVSGAFLVVRQKSPSPRKLDEAAGTVERRDTIAGIAPTRKSQRPITYKPDHRSRATIARASTPRRISTATRTTARTRSSSTDFTKQTVALSEKKDSKVNVVFKKTGNALKKTVTILRKPFDL